MEMFSLINSASLVGGGTGEGCSSYSDTFVGSVEHRVESLEESLAVDKVKSFPTRGANVTNDQVNFSSNTTNVRVKGTRPDLSVGSQSECSLIKRGYMNKSTPNHYDKNIRTPAMTKFKVFRFAN
jgi:hypothetical protein